MGSTGGGDGSGRDEIPVKLEAAGGGGSGGGVDLAKVAARTAGMSGADLANVVNEAALLAVREGTSWVEQAHFEAAVEKQRAYRPGAARTPVSGLVLGL
jgi:ATP-dependent Zn protease